MKKNLNDSELKISNVTSFCADNASVNFGKNHSVYTELRKHNKNLIAVGCNNHIIHNTAKKSFSVLRFDIELVVIKIYNEFSASTKKTAELKEFFEWTENTWKEQLQHVPTRWMTLLPAINRLLSNFEPVKSYFMSQKIVSPLLRMFFEFELAEAYLGFLANVCSTAFEPALRKLQSHEALILETFEIMDTVRHSLKEKQKDKFYGSLAQNKLISCLDSQAIARFKIDADNFFQTAITYFEKWYNFKDNIFSNLRSLKLTELPDHQTFTEIVDKFQIGDINNDYLYEEIISLKLFFSKMNVEQKSLIDDQKWVQFFIAYPNTPNLLKIISFIFSIPHSNAPSERIFSLMATFWRKERNKLLLKNLEAELMVKENYKLNCIDFVKFLKSSDGLEILNKIKSSEKYLV